MQCANTNGALVTFEVGVWLRSGLVSPVFDHLENDPKTIYTNPLCSQTPAL